MSDEEYGGDDEDVYEEVTYDSWGDRLKSSCGGICIGLILFFGSVPLLFWNEGRAVERYDTLREGEQLTTSISTDSIDPAREGGLVHFTATVKGSGNLTDPIFGVLTDDLKLRRTVEMYQWKESVQSKKEKKIGGGTKTTKTYSYAKSWQSSAVNSANFKNPSGHENPGSMRFEQRVVAADNVTVGAFRLPQELVNRISWYSPLRGVSKDNIPDADIRAEAEEYSDGFYFGDNPSSPAVGDTRVSFATVPEGTISVVAKQTGNTFTAYQAEAGGTILLLRQGTYSVEAMYEQAAEENRILTWVLRFAGYFAMGFGLYLVLQPIEVFADVIPCVGDIVGCGIKFLAFVVAGFLSGLVIAIAWLIYHPVIGIIVLVVIASITAGIAFLVKWLKNKKEKRTNADSDSLNELELSPEDN